MVGIGTRRGSAKRSGHAGNSGPLHRDPGPNLGGGGGGGGGGGRLPRAHLVSYPDPDSQQLRVDWVWVRD